MKHPAFKESILGIVMILLIVTVAESGQQAGKASLPVVIAAAVPLYPIGPHTVNIQGIVRIRISTDGRRLIDTRIEDDGGNVALARTAQENARTWQFSNHEPTSFTVTYHYILVDRLPDIESNALNSKVVLRFPTDVEVYAQHWPGTVDMPVTVK